MVLQPLEIARECDADHVRTRRQELAELDIARPEPRERRRQPASAVLLLGRSIRRARRRRNARRRRQHRRIDDAENAFAGEHETGAAETDEIRGAGNHKRQPECSATIPPVMILWVTRAKPAARSMASKAGGLGKRRIDSTR